MTTIQWLAVGGGFCGSLGSILTAFSVSRSIFELNFARQTVFLTVEQLVNRGRIPIFTGHDERFKRATKRDGRLLWFGVVLLVLGFVLQASSTFLTPSGP